MSPRGWASLALAVALAVAGVWIYSTAMDSKVARAEQAASEMKGKVDALQEQAGELVAKADGHAKDASAAAEEVRTLKAKLARIQKRKTVAAFGEPGPVVPDEPADSASDLKDQIIDAQDRQIVALNLEVDGLRSALVLKDQALVTQEQRVRGLEIALDAQRHAAKSGKWMGRIQGFAAGIGVGYISGRLR